MPETRQEPCKNDRNPLKHWHVCQKNRACGASTPYPPNQLGRIGQHRRDVRYVGARDGGRKLAWQSARAIAFGSELGQEGGPVGGPQNNCRCGYLSWLITIIISITCTTQCMTLWHQSLYIISNTRENQSATPWRWYLEGFGRRRRPKCDVREARSV